VLAWKDCVLFTVIALMRAPSYGACDVVDAISSQSSDVRAKEFTIEIRGVSHVAVRFGGASPNITVMRF